jgi:amidohydrolase
MALELFDMLLKNSLSHHLHTALELNESLALYPELSAHEFESAKKIVTILTNSGIETQAPFLEHPTAFRGIIRGQKSVGPNVKAAILTEYDALPGVGHACGHSASGSLSVLAALVLNDLKAHFSGEIHIIGTPDEEVQGGKISLAKLGAFNGYDFAIMIHMGNYNAVYSEFLSLDGLFLEFHGQNAHAAAAPWEGKNALNGVQLLFHAVDMMRQHVRSDIKIHGVIKSGGEAANIVPNYSCAEFYTRGKSRSQLDDVSSWVREAAQGAAAATRTRVEITPLCPSLRGLTRIPSAEARLKEIYKSAGEILVSNPDLLGSSDIGEVDLYCPTFHPMIKVHQDAPMHSKAFADQMLTPLGHKAIETGAKIMTEFVLNMLTDTSLLQQVKKEYESNREK